MNFSAIKIPFHYKISIKDGISIKVETLLPCKTIITYKIKAILIPLPADNFKKYKKKHTPNNNAIL